MTLRDLAILAVLIAAYLTASTTQPRPSDPTSNVHQGRQGWIAHSGSRTGEASWYDDGPGYYGAVHSYRWGDPRYRVEVCRADNDEVCVTVTVRDHMANRVRAIDLSPSAFHALWPGLTRHEALILRGVVDVTVSRGGAAPRVTLPPTDTAP